MAANCAGEIAGDFFAKRSLSLSPSRDIDEYHNESLRSGSGRPFVRKISRSRRSVSAQRTESLALIGRGSKKNAEQLLTDEKARTLLILLICHRAQMRVKRNPVPCPQRMFHARENLYARKMGSQEFAKTGASKKILVVTFQQMPGNSFPIFEIRNHLDVRH